MSDKTKQNENDNKPAKVATPENAKPIRAWAKDAKTGKMVEVKPG